MGAGNQVLLPRRWAGVEGPTQDVPSYPGETRKSYFALALCFVTLYRGLMEAQLMTSERASQRLP